MIALIDYGCGNIQAFAHIYKRLNVPFRVVRSKSELANAKKFILPGVGAFDWAMSRLEESGLREMLDELVLERQLPVMGVCVGMQMMANDSEEGVTEGLGWIDAKVRRFDVAKLTQRTHLPHMGWNDVVSVKEDPLMTGLALDARFYFLHSYYFAPKNCDEVLAQSDYGCKFAAVVKCNNAYGVQFHPEKSHLWGISLLKNFADFC